MFIGDLEVYEAFVNADMVLAAYVGDDCVFTMNNSENNG